MRIAFDTSILVYAEGHTAAAPDTAKVATAAALLGRLRESAAPTLVLPAQVLGELFTVLTRKAGRSPAATREVVLAWRAIVTVQPTTETVLLDACDLAAGHGLQIWDAVIVAAAAEAGCGYLFAEDAAICRIGTHRGVRMLDPFADPPPSELALRLR